jgi:hypothetical protein
MQRAGPENVDFARAFAGATWFDVVPRTAVCPELPRHVLLHAGPPFRESPPAPVVNAAVQALLFERLAADEAEARNLLSRGEVTLRPAQEHAIVTPLAQVVSASMLLCSVRHHEAVAHGALLEGASPALRFGSSVPACRQRLESLNAWMKESVAAGVRRAPIALDEVIRRAVTAGDECHSRTAAANTVLVSRIDGLDPAVAESLRALPAFVLPILMAGAAAALRHFGRSIDAVGGNGVDFGVRHRGESTWRQVPALAPRSKAPGGGLPSTAATVPLPAIGDSVLIDYCGLGGVVDAPELRALLLDPQSGIVDPSRVAACGTPPAFNLAILDRAGELGLIGRGTYYPPPELFE